MKKLAALISASLAPNTESWAQPLQTHEPTMEDNAITMALLNESVSQHLAAHRSHSSHGSHRSHRSSSSGGYSAPSTPSPAITPRRATPLKQQADPLGQPSRPLSSYPSREEESLSKQLSDADKRKNIIMRMQLTLQFEGYYEGAVDGIMGPKTRAAVLAYKKDKGLSGSAVLDAATLNALGIKGY